MGGGIGSLKRPQLERVVGELSLDLGAPRRDLRGPVALGIGRDHLIRAQAALKIDSGTPESREPGSDLAIGHAHISSQRCAQATRSHARILIGPT